MAFWLAIRFNSNEHPWSNDRYDPYPRDITRESAILWALGMQAGMPDYTITLFEDGKVLRYDQAQQEAA